MTRVKPILDVAATILIVVAAGLVIWRHVVPPHVSQERAPVEPAKGVLAPDLVATHRGDGPVVLVEFADFQCPFCGKHARDTEPLIRKAFVDSGLVRQVFLHFPLQNHPRAQPASKAAVCAGRQGRFWDMHDGLFQNQSALEEHDFAARALAVGVDAGQFSKCLSDVEAHAIIERDIAAGRQLNVRATPSFFLGVVQADGSVQIRTRINGAVAFDEFRSAIIDVMPPKLRSLVRPVALNWFAPIVAVR